MAGLLEVFPARARLEVSCQNTMESSCQLPLPSERAEVGIPSLIAPLLYLAPVPAIHPSVYISFYFRGSVSFPHSSDLSAQLPFPPSNYTVLLPLHAVLRCANSRPPPLPGPNRRSLGRHRVAESAVAIEVSVLFLAPSLPSSPGE